jgi:hypothetical protein
MDPVMLAGAGVILFLVGYAAMVIGLGWLDKH